VPAVFTYVDDVGHAIGRLARRGRTPAAGAGAGAAIPPGPASHQHGPG